MIIFYRDIVELLLSYEASCNSADDKGSSPLHLAAWAGNKEIVDVLLTKGPSIANVNLTVSSTLHEFHIVLVLICSIKHRFLSAIVIYLKILDCGLFLESEKSWFLWYQQCGIIITRNAFFMIDSRFFAYVLYFIILKGKRKFNGFSCIKFL